MSILNFILQPKLICMANGIFRVFVISILIATAPIFIQSRTLPPRKIPRMWMSMKVSQEREKNFSKKKMVLGTGHPSSYSFDTTSFNELIEKLKGEFESRDEPRNGINVYFAAPDADQNEFSPVGKVNRNQLVLIFAPAEENISGDHYYKDLAGCNYYALNVSNKLVYNITATTKDAWIKNYVDNVIGDQSHGLASTVVDSKENYVGNQLSDTRAISYAFKDFEDFITDERRYQNSLSTNKINGIDIYFAAYSDAGVGCNYNRYDYSWFKRRLLVLFEFTKKVHGLNKPFYINISGRPHDGICTDLQFFGADNGSLCPPCTNCPPNTPGCTK